MKTKPKRFLVFVCIQILALAALWAQPVAGTSGEENLAIASAGQTSAVVAVAPDAGDRPWERRAAEDLVRYIGLMCGIEPALADTADTIAAALAGKDPVLLVGEVALETKPELRRILTETSVKNPVLRPDAIVLRREGNRVYLAGIDPPEEHVVRRILKGEGHYYAAARLLHLWGLPLVYADRIRRSRARA